MLRLFGLYKLSQWLVENEHNTKLRDAILVALAFGALAVFLDVLVLVRPGTESYVPFLTVCGVVALPGAVLLVVRLVRPFRGRDAITPTRCKFCGREASVTPVRYLAVTGALIVFFLRERAGFACKRCNLRQFAIMTGFNLLLGWASVFSLFIFQGFLLHNVLFLLRSLGGGSDVAYARKQAFRILDEQREYAKSLVATKEDDDVVYVLQKQTDLPNALVADYVRTLRREAGGQAGVR